MKRLSIIQPGRMGDLLLTIPIAYRYFQQGYEIFWPVCSEYIDLFNYLTFPIDVFDLGSIREGGRNIYNKAYKTRGSHYLDLAIGFGNIDLDNQWKQTGLSFDLWKYNKAKLEYQDKYLLKHLINRDYEKERDLKKMLMIFHLDKYYIFHEYGSHNRYFNFPNKEKYEPNRFIAEVKGFNVFDWIGVLENALAIFCVDSCFANLVDQLKLNPKEGLYFHSWKEYYNELQLSRLTPKISNKWKLI